MNHAVIGKTTFLLLHCLPPTSLKPSLIFQVKDNSPLIYLLRFEDDVEIKAFLFFLPLIFSFDGARQRNFRLSPFPAAAAADDDSGADVALRHHQTGSRQNPPLIGRVVVSSGPNDDAVFPRQRQEVPAQTIYDRATRITPLMGF